MSCICSHLAARCNQIGRKEEKKPRLNGLDLLLHLTIKGCPNIVREKEARRRGLDVGRKSRLLRSLHIEVLQWLVRWFLSLSLMCFCDPTTLFFFCLLANDYRKSRAHELLFSVHWWCRYFVHPSEKRNSTLVMSDGDDSAAVRMTSIELLV